MKSVDLFGHLGATFSPCRQYRYTLWRRWSQGATVNFLMLNPSTADETTNDPTIERCERRAREMCYGELVVTNLFAFRSTDPRAMKSAADPIGPENDAAILREAKRSIITVCAWGQHGKHLDRAAKVLEMLRLNCVALMALKVAKNGEPCHPLYLPYGLKPKAFGVKGQL